MTDDDWMTRGLCAEEVKADLSVAELFFPDPGGKNDALEAKDLCSRCTVQVDCLRFAMSTAVDGIWGGTTAKERQEMRRRMGKSLPSGWPRPIDHGDRGRSPAAPPARGEPVQIMQRRFGATTQGKESRQVNDDLPIIRCQPTPTDAELQAERDRKHALDVAAFFDEERRFREYEEMRAFTGLDHLPPWQVHG